MFCVWQHYIDEQGLLYPIKAIEQGLPYYEASQAKEKLNGSFDQKQTAYKACLDTKGEVNRPTKVYDLILCNSVECKKECEK